MADEYEDDFEDYEDDFEPEAAPAPPPEEPPSPPLGRHTPWSLITLDELVLGAELASGSAGVVRAATWRGQPVAVKTLLDTSTAELRKVEEELLIHAALAHPRVVELLGASLSPPGCCIVLERCECSLFERLHGARAIASGAELDRRQLVGWAIQVAEALSFLHSRSPPVVHRDVKTHNVLLSRGGEDAKLCDFGLVTVRETAAGTPNYMAPELFESKPFSTPVDVFAFAVLLNELFTQTVPWDGYAPLDIKERVCRGDRPRSATAMPRVCEGLVRKGWHASPAMRPSFDAMLLTLRDVEDSLPMGRSLSSSLPFGTSPVDALDEFASLGLGTKAKSKSFGASM